MSSQIRNAYQGATDMLSFDGSNLENFSANMKAIDIALNRNCNLAGSGVCKMWCPNCQKNRPEEEQVMSKEMIVQVCKQLKAAGYKGGLSFNRYNEPFHMDDFADKVWLFRSLLPTNKLGCNTNGTLVTAQNLRRVYEAGLTSMNFQIYPYTQKDREEFSKKWADGELKKICERLGLSIDESKTQTIDGFYYEYSAILPADWYVMPGAKLVIYAKNLSKLGCSRAGSVQGLERERTSPCSQIGRFLGIDANGDVSPCTNFTGRLVKGHEEYILGNLKDEKIWDIYAKVKDMATSLTNNFCSASLHKYSPCVGCNFMPHVQQISSLK